MPMSWLTCGSSGMMRRAAPCAQSLSVTSSYPTMRRAWMVQHKQNSFTIKHWILHPRIKFVWQTTSAHLFPFLEISDQCGLVLRALTCWGCSIVADSVTLYSFMSIVIRSRALGNERLTGTLSTVGHRFQGLGWPVARLLWRRGF